MEDLYRRHATEAIRLAYLLTGDRDIAEDLAQEAFVRLVGRFQHIRSPDSFPPYLRRTVINLVKNHFRRLGVERAYLAAAAGAPVAAHRDEGWSYHEIRDALFRLSYRQRAAIVLRLFEDLPEAQVAELLSCRPGTVKSLVSRGLQSLREATATLEVNGE